MQLLTLWPIQDGKILGFLLLVFIFAYTTRLMNSEKEVNLRRVPGLDAIEDAVGRSTEMGKPIVASYGWAFQGFDYWTVSGLTLLSHIADLCARNNTRIIVPTGGSAGSYVVRPVAVDIVKNSFESHGKGDRFNENDLPFLSGTQFAMSSGYAGILLKEKPGSNIMAGFSAADAVMIAEVSNQVNAITITTPTYIGNVAVLACASDYIMIGEEAIAAGAYLSKDKAQIAGIRTQDLCKFLAIGLIITGCLFSLLGIDFLENLLMT